MKPMQSLPLEVEWSFYGTHRFKRYRILVIDHARGILGNLVDSLGDVGFQVITATNAASALVKARAAMPSLIVVNLGAQRTSGLEVCRQVKADHATTHIPIIILSAKSTAEERIQGLELGADDYLTQPFRPRELVLRIRNSLQRAEWNQPSEVKMTLDDLVLDPVLHEVTLHHQPVYLSSNEFRLLNFFMERCGDVLDRDTLLSEVWGQVSSTVTRTVDTHVRRLRNKLGSWGQRLESVRSMGYRLSENVPAFVNEPVRMQPTPHFLERLDERKTLFSKRKKSRFVVPSHKASVLVGAGTD